MLRYMLHTNPSIRVLRDRPHAARLRFNQAADGLCISTIVLTELLLGAAKSASPTDNRRSVEALVARLIVVAFDDNAAAHAAEIRATLERQGNRSAAMTCSSPATPAVAAWS